MLHGLPVRVVGVGGGFEYGHAGITHHALEDLAIARVQPGLSVIAPGDARQAGAALRATYDLSGPIYYRFGKRDDYELPALDGRFRLGRVEIVMTGADILVVALGAISSEAVIAAEKTKRTGHRRDHGPGFFSASSACGRPHRSAKALPVAITVEEHYLEGGLGSLVCEVAAEAGCSCRVVRCGVRTLPGTRFGGERHLREANGLSGDGIFNTALKALGADS